MNQNLSPEELATDQRFMSTIIDTIDSLVIVLDLAGRVERINQAALTFLGMEEKQARHQFLWDLVGYPAEACTEGFLADLLQAGQPYQSTVAQQGWRNGQGQIRQVEWTASPIRDGQGQITHLVVSGRDATAKYRTIEDLKAVRIQIDQIAANVDEVFYIRDLRSSAILYISPNYERLFGAKVADLIQDPNSFLRAVHPDDLPLVTEQLARLPIHGPEEFEYRVIRPDGMVRWLRHQGTPIYDEAGTLSQSVGMLKDITKDKQASQRMERRLRMESLVTHLSTNFASAFTDEIDQVINECLTEIGLFVGADRSYIFEMDQDAGLMHNTYEWCHEGIEPQLEFLQNQSIDLFAWTLERLRRGEIFNVPLVADMPPEAQAEKEILEMQDIQSVLIVGLRDRGQIFGFMGFDAVRQPRTWFEDDMNLLQLIGEVIVNALRRKRIALDLQHSETRFRQLADNMEDIFFLVDLETNQFIYINSAYERIWGYKAEELYRDSTFAMQIVHPEDRDGFRQIDQYFLDGGSEQQQHTFRVRFADGRWRWIMEKAFPIYNEAGQVYRLGGLLQDITSLVEAQNTLERTADRLAILNQIARQLVAGEQSEIIAEMALSRLGSVLPIDFGCVIEHDAQNRSAFILSQTLHCQLNALQMNALMQFTQTIAQSENPLGVGYMADIQENLSDQTEALRPIRQQGVHTLCLVPLQVHDQMLGALCLGSQAVDVLDEEARLMLKEVGDLLAVGLQRQRLSLSLQAYTQELEERVVERTARLNRLNAELARANRLKDEFLANMSHELRTPLNAVLLKAELMAEGIQGPLTGRQMRSLEVIRESGGHLLALLNDILDLAKIEADRFELLMQRVSVSHICRVSLQFVEEMALGKQIKISTDWPSEQLYIQADERRLKQILINLLSNAVKFTPPGGEVCLIIEPDARAEVLHIRVKDTGIGIAEADLPRLFQPFSQIDGKLNRQHGGTGLGLTLVKHLTERQNGSVSVQSAVNVGSCFTVSLPWQAESPHPHEPLPDSHPVLLGPTGEPATLLIVDDNIANLDSIGEFLSFHSFHIVEAHDGYECLNRLAEEEIDLVIMDIQMPKMDGFEATQRIRRNPAWQHIPILALTALAMPGDRERALAAGADEYIPKPPSLPRLLELIHYHLARTNNSQSSEREKA